MIRDWLSATSLARLVRFGLVGLSATLLYGVIAWTLEALRWTGPMVGHVVAYAVALPVSYLLQRSFTFRSTRRHREALPRFLVTSGLAFALSTAVVEFGPAWFGLARWQATLAVMAIVPAVSFLTMLLWVFVTPREPAP